MIWSDLKPGAVYRYGSFDELYVVVKVLDNAPPGAHVWLGLTGHDAGHVDIVRRSTAFDQIEDYTLLVEGV